MISLIARLCVLSWGLVWKILSVYTQPMLKFKEPSSLGYKAPRLQSQDIIKLAVRFLLRRSTKLG